MRTNDNVELYLCGASALVWLVLDEVHLAPAKTFRRCVGAGHCLTIARMYSSTDVAQLILMRC